MNMHIHLGATASVRLLMFVLGGTLLFIILPAGVMLIRSIRKAKEQHQRLNLKCHHCGYDRIGHLQATTCPECGGQLVDYARRYGLDASAGGITGGNRSAKDRVS